MVARDGDEEALHAARGAEGVFDLAGAEGAQVAVPLQQQKPVRLHQEVPTLTLLTNVTAGERWPGVKNDIIWL